MTETASILHATALMRTLTIDDNGVTLTNGCAPLSPVKKQRKIRVISESSYAPAPDPEPVLKKKRKIRIISSTSDETESISTAESSSTMKEGAKTMPPKRASAKAPVEERVLMLHVTSFEKEMNVLPVVDVETVRLVLLEHAGKTYYHDPTKHKLYTRIGAKAVGAYVGRWDPRSERICTDVHDSDADN